MNWQPSSTPGRLDAGRKRRIEAWSESKQFQSRRVKQTNPSFKLSNLWFSSLSCTSLESAWLDQCNLASRPIRLAEALHVSSWERLVLFPYRYLSRICPSQAEGLALWYRVQESPLIREESTKECAWFSYLSTYKALDKAFWIFPTLQGKSKRKLESWMQSNTKHPYLK